MPVTKTTRKKTETPTADDAKRVRGSKSSVKRDSVTKRQIDIPNPAYNDIKMVNLLRTSANQANGTTLHDLLVEAIEVGSRMMKAHAEGKPAPYVAALVEEYYSQKK